MNKSDFFSIAIKIFGLYLIYLSIEHLFYYGFLIYSEFENNDVLTSFNLSHLILSVSFLISGSLIVIKTDKIVQLVCKEDKKVDIGLEKKELLEVGISIFSLVLITYSATKLLSYFIDSTYFHDHRLSEFLNHDKTRIIAQTSVELVAGIFLLFNTKNFASRIINIKEDKTPRNQ